jgi:hypothetical protein
MDTALYGTSPGRGARAPARRDRIRYMGVVPAAAPRNRRRDAAPFGPGHAGRSRLAQILPSTRFSGSGGHKRGIGGCVRRGFLGCHRFRGAQRAAATIATDPPRTPGARATAAASSALSTIWRSTGVAIAVHALVRGVHNEGRVSRPGLHRGCAGSLIPDQGFTRRRLSARARARRPPPPSSSRPSCRTRSGSASSRRAGNRAPRGRPSPCTRRGSPSRAGRC